MKKTLLLITFLISLIGYNMVLGQCTPGDAETCPDPENNGQICPDSLPNAAINNLYGQEFTILPPSFFVTETNDTIQFHHIQLMDIENLPEGFSWVSNSADSVFIPGEYYCVVIEGTPNAVGFYQLRIIVDIYVEPIPGFPVWIAQQVDSTSLSVQVTWDPNGVDTFDKESFDFQGGVPNPFSHTSKLGFYTTENGSYELSLYDLLGNLIYKESMNAISGDNYFQYDGKNLPEGMYICSISNQYRKISRRIIKSR